MSKDENLKVGSSKECFLDEKGQKKLLKNRILLEIGNQSQADGTLAPFLKV